VAPLSAHRWRVMHKPVALRRAVELQLNQLGAEPPHRLVLHQEDAAAVFIIEYRPERTEPGKRFTQMSEFTAKTLPGGVLQGAFGWAVRREVRRQLRSLKALLERDAVHGE
jgi:hypothetical protein